MRRFEVMVQYINRIDATPENVIRYSVVDTSNGTEVYVGLEKQCDRIMRRLNMREGIAYETDKKLNKISQDT